MERSDSSSWGIPMTFGVLTILFGVLAIGVSVLTSIVSALTIGATLAIAGGLEIGNAIRARHEGPWVTMLLAGLLGVVIGGLFMARPLVGVASLTLLIAAYLFASGLFRGITSILDRYPGWGWDLAYGVFAVMLGAYVAVSWPVTGLWLLGTVVGAEILARGVAIVAASWKLRELEKIVEARP